MSYVQKVTIDGATLYQGDCIEVMRGMANNSVDSIVCDPPYLLGFMGKAWDAADGIAGKPDVWREAWRVLKPGGHLLAFGAPRTNHRMVTAIEDAGFEIRDSVMYIFGTGFPKSMDVSAAIDKAAGALREVAGKSASATMETKKWQGWGTALKPAYEPVCVARKPLDKSTVAANLMAWGAGAINIDGCRVQGIKSVPSSSKTVGASSHTFSMPGNQGTSGWDANVGRWPANIILDGSPEVLGVFPVTTSGAQKPHINKSVAKNTVASFSAGLDGCLRDYTAPASTGSAARFFYTAKASKRDRDEGLDYFQLREAGSLSGGADTRTGMPKTNQPLRANSHPTVKPTDLMAYLCRLVTPPGGTVLDCFMGSGSTGKAAMIEGFLFVGIEQEAEYFDIAQARIRHARGKLFLSTGGFK